MAENQARSTSIGPPPGELGAACTPAPRPTGDQPAKGSAVRGGAVDPSTASRRAIFGLLIGAIVVGILCILDYLPALYATVVLGHVVVALRWRRRAGMTVPGAVHIAPTPVGVMVLATLWVLLLLAVFLPSASFRLLACVLAACACVGWPLATANVARVEVTRTIAARARANVPTALDLVATNSTGRCAEHLRLEDELGLSTRPGSVEIAIDAVGARSQAVARVCVTFERRGRRRLRPIRISSTYPLGIFAATRDTEAPAEILVHPREGVPTAALIERLRGKAREPIRARATRAGPEEFHGLREFRDGDDPRRIHWATSARRGTPTFVLRREEPARRVVVALAACRTRDRAADEAFERAVSAAAGILRAARDLGCETTLVLSHRPARGPVAVPTADDSAVIQVRHPRDLTRALDALALVKPDGDRDPKSAFAHSGAASAHGALVWISSTPEGAREIPGAAEGVAVSERIRLRADDASFARFVSVPS